MRCTENAREHVKLWTMGIILTFKWDSHGRGELQVSGVYGVEWCIERNPNPGVTTHAWLFFTHQQFTFKQHPDETGAITNLLDGSFDWCCKYIKRETREQRRRDSTSLHFCLHPISASCMSNAATEWVFLWCLQLLIPPAAAPAGYKQSQQNMSGGDGAGKWKQPVQAMTFADS